MWRDYLQIDGEGSFTWAGGSTSTFLHVNADFNRDRVTNSQDFFDFLRRFSKSCD